MFVCPTVYTSDCSALLEFHGLVFAFDATLGMYNPLSVPGARLQTVADACSGLLQQPGCLYIAQPPNFAGKRWKIAELIVAVRSHRQEANLLLIPDLHAGLVAWRSKREGIVETFHHTANTIRAGRLPLDLSSGYSNWQSVCL
jgi:hypothetical protein